MKKAFFIFLFVLMLLPVCALAQDLVVTGGDGYEWDASNSVLTINASGLTIQNAAGKSTTADRIVISDNVTSVTLTGVTIETDDGPAMQVEGGTTVTLTGVNTLNTTAFDCAGLQQDDADTLLTITGTGSLTAKGGEYAAGIGGGSCDANILINGGVITLAQGCGGAGIGSGEDAEARVTITGSAKIVKAISIPSAWGGGAGIGGGSNGNGTVEISGNAHIVSAVGGGERHSDIFQTGFGGSGIGGGYDADVTIKDNALIEEAIGGAYGAGIGNGSGEEAKVVISGNAQIFKAVGGYLAAGIGGGYQGEADLTITGGLIRLAQGDLGAAGIGSGGTNDSPASIAISGGTIEKAQGGMGGAGIGSGVDAAYAEVTISGGVINAIGGTDYSYHFKDENDEVFDITYGAGAGIGGGGDSYANVTITGGTINATGGGVRRGGAGIGGGGNGRGTVTISGKNTLIKLAQGGLGGAGIGGGINTEGYVAISSAMVDLARGGEGAPGVGSGENAYRRGTVTLADDPGEVSSDGSIWTAIEGSPFNSATNITDTTAHFHCFRTKATPVNPPAVDVPGVPNVPQTGDDSMVGVWLMLMALSAATIVLASKRRVL